MAIKPKMSNHTRTKYIRICAYCADLIGAISRGEKDT